jgi:hypothetical protein
LSPFISLQWPSLGLASFFERSRPWSVLVLSSAHLVLEQGSSSAGIARLTAFGSSRHGALIVTASTPLLSVRLNSSPTSADAVYDVSARDLNALHTSGLSIMLRLSVSGQTVHVPAGTHMVSPTPVCSAPNQQQAHQQHQSGSGPTPSTTTTTSGIKSNHRDSRTVL